MTRKHTPTAGGLRLPAPGATDIVRWPAGVRAPIDRRTVARSITPLPAALLGKKARPLAA